MLLPEPRFLEHTRQDRLGSVKGAIETAKKPLQPWGDVEVILLRRFKDVVVGASLLPDLRRHAVEALRALFGTRERHVGDGARDTAIAIVERMDGEEPQMSDAGLEDRINLCLSF